MRSQLWDLLPQLGELSAATHSVMALLAHLYGPAVAPGRAQSRGPAGGGPSMDAEGAGNADGGEAGGEAGAAVGAVEAGELAARMPRLWPFLRHALSTVRRSALQCLERLLRHRAPAPGGGGLRGAAASEPPAWLQPLLPALLQLVFQVM